MGVRSLPSVLDLSNNSFPVLEIAYRELKIPEVKPPRMLLIDCFFELIDVQMWDAAGYVLFPIRDCVFEMLREQRKPQR